MTTEHRRGMIVPGTQLGHYQIISMLGAGGMGEVYLAQDLRLGRKVALKLLLAELTRDERDLRRFEHEAQAASALNHPNILTIYEFGQAGGLRFIVSEYIEGLTLRYKMASGRMELILRLTLPSRLPALWLPLMLVELFIATSSPTM